MKEWDRTADIFTEHSFQILYNSVTKNPKTSSQSEKMWEEKEGNSKAVDWTKCIQSN